MKEIEIIQLYDTPYSVTVINALKQYWRKSRTFSCIGAPKRTDMLLFLDGCKAVYTLKDGNKIFVPDQSIVYVPINAEYSVKFYDFVTAHSNTVHINFLLYDRDNAPFVLSNSIKVFSADNCNYKALFNRIDSYSEANVICFGKISSIMYDILFKLSEFYRKDHRNKYSIIAKGIEYLEQNEAQQLSISEIAKECNVSEVYFRKLFKEYSGTSPADYRAAARLCRAKNYLKQECISVNEISDLLGFTDVSYFIRTFKKSTGVTPGEYRKSIK